MPASKKTRIDQLLVDKGLAPTRTRAQSLIMAGVVTVGTERVNKASETFLSDSDIRIKEADHPYVGRGGLKLKAALDFFNIEVKDKFCLDIGASTGGFTDCLLQNGAKKVYAVDVGYGQLDYKLQSDSRVVVFDRTNFRHFDISLLTEAIDIAVMDASFISATKLIPKIVEIFKPEKEKGEGARRCAPTVIILVKPQFEVGADKIGKKGVVRDEESRLGAVKTIEKFSVELGFEIVGSIPSPIKGQEGNQEYLLVLRWKGL